MKEYLKKILGLTKNEKRRIEWVKSELSKIESGKKILDAGCGKQIYRKYCSRLDYKAQDFGQYDGKGSGEGLQTKVWEYGKLDYVGDIWDINEKEQTFDVVLCTEVLEHVPYPNETLKEFARLLKPGGLMILTAPFCSLPHMQPFYFFNGFSKDYYKYFLEKYNCEILTIEENGNAYEFILQEMLRTINSQKTIVSKLFSITYVGFFIVPFLKLMDKFSSNNSKYLHMGYHIRAKKLVRR